MWILGLKGLREYKTVLDILDSTLWTPDSRYWIPESLSLELRFQILIVSGIPDSHLLCRASASERNN